MSDKEQKAREEFVEAVIASLNSTEPVKQGTALKAVSKLYELYELQPPLVVWCESLWQLAVMPPLLLLPLLQPRRLELPLAAQPRRPLLNRSN